ncbi:ehhadh, partial [Symbiodinium microadriaticum]
MRGLDQARQDKGDGLVLFGEKNFSAGADIAEFASGKHRVSPGLNEVLCALDNFDKPLLACINGVALGGGLETALSCQWRLCSPKTVVGLPEVHLGILPGAGGTQRLPRLIGVEKALEIMLSGRNVTAAEALKLGIVDSVSDAPFESEEHLVDCAYNFILTD